MQQYKPYNSASKYDIKIFQCGRGQIDNVVEKKKVSSGCGDENTSKLGPRKS